MESATPVHTCEVEIVEDSRRFEALEQEWRDLYQDAPQATPFQSWEWLYSWWEAYGDSYRLKLVTLRDNDDRLVGIVPLMLEDRGPFSRLLFVGTGVTDYLDVLVREGWQRPVARASVLALRDLGPWQAADLQELRPEAAAWEIFAGWPGAGGSVHQNSCPRMPVGEWDDTVDSLKKNLRKRVRKDIRRAEEDGLLRRLVPSEESGRAARRFLELHREMWKGREIAPEHLSPRFELFVTAAAQRLVHQGIAEISELWSDGRVAASTFVLLGEDSVMWHLQGADQEFMQRYQVSSRLIQDNFFLARKRGKHSLDMLRGEEEYKLKWCTEVVYNRRLLLGRNRAYGKVYALYRGSRYAMRSYLDSEDAPRWMQTLLSPLRGR